MAINLKFDLMGNPESPSIVLANRNGNKLGQLNVNVESIDVSDKFNAASEFSFTLNKYIDDELTPLWNKVVDFKLVYCPEWDLWFEIKVELDETTETVKTVFCTQLGQAELSQIKVYNIHINEEGDPNWDINNETYKSTILYDKEHTDTSLLHRILKDKAPHYSIAYVDESIQRIQKTFSFDDTSICDAFNEIAEEIGCLFVYNSNSTKGGKPSRTISVYDLQQNCNDCGHRGEFTDKCPKCESTNIKYGYGEDTTIFVTSDELATEGIQLVTDVDSVKNCFKLEGGDDLMTATIRNCNPNGSDYIWYFSDSLKEDMSDELVEKLESYDKKYKEYYNNHPSTLNSDLVAQYNVLVEKYDDYYNTKSTCLDCNNEDYFYEQCSNSNCNSKNILVGQKLQTIDTTITGYPDLMTAYYNTIDLLLYLESGLMPTPDIEANKTSAEEQIALLTTSSLSPVAVNVKEAEDISETTSKSAVLSMAKVLIKSTYKVEAETLAFTDVVDADGIIVAKTWEGKFTVTNYSDDTDTAISDGISVTVNVDAKTFIEQKIQKTLNKENTDDYSITGLFAKDYNEFCEEITKYALNPLDSFSKSCDICLSILQEQGVGESANDEDNTIETETKKVLYDELYKPYFDKQQAVNKEIAIRQNEIAIIEGVWDKSDEDSPKCTTDGLQQCIEKCQRDIQEALDFENHLGEDLWLEFCAYRREDKYSNSNYISDGLDNAELFKKANEFIEVAEEEIFKSAELQHSISATLNNLLSLPKFKPILKSFKTGNWIRVQVDDKVYKLRLLEYGFEYGDMESISVEFSDVTKIKNGVTDVKEVLEQASSMASSYDSVQRQAEKGNVARSTIDQWLINGLDSANVQIKNNDSEEILLTKSGLLARSYDDITGTYSPEQFKLTHNIMAYTDDNWETVSAALGKHNYKYYKDGNFIDAEGYGMSAKFAQAAYIIGSQIISGEIVSNNYQPNKSGTYFDLNKGNFEIAGGKIAYNASSDIVTLDGVTIVWDDDSTNAPTITQIDGLSDALDKLGNLSNDAEQSAKDYADEQDKAWSNTLTEAYKQYTDSEINEFDSYVAKYLGLSGDTIVGNNYLISPYIGGGYLNITNANNESRVIIDPNNLTGNAYIFQVHNGDKVTVGVKSDGSSEFSGTIRASNFIGGSLFIGDTTKTYAEISTDGKLTCAKAQISGDIKADSLTLNKDIKLGNETNGYHTQITTDGILTAKGAKIEDNFTATNGSITSCSINTCAITNATIDEGTITDATIGDCTINGGSLKMGTEDNGYHTWISEEGKLYAQGAHIDGTITAAGDTGSQYHSLVSIDQASPICFKAGGTDDNFIIENKTLTFTSDGNLWSETISLNDEQKTTYLITNAKCLTSNKVHEGSGKSSDISLRSSTFANNEGYYYASTTVDLLPGWVSEEHIVELSIDNSIMQVSYIGDGKVRVSVNALLPNALCSGSIKYHYLFDEKLNISFDIAEDKDKVTCSFYPQTTNIKYEIDVQYVCEPKNFGFKVLRDGSLYANATYIRGTVYATDGEIGGCSIANGLLQISNANISEKLTANNIDGTNLEVVDGTFSGSISVNDGVFKVDKNGTMTAEKATITGGTITMPDESDKWIELGTGGGLRVLDLEAHGGYYACAQYSANVLRYGRSTSFNGEIENTNTFMYDCYGLNPYIMLTGTWSGNSSGSIVSDQNMKNHIEHLDERYEILFDNLIPKRFYYNDGTSQRYHTGYIAQDVQSAIKISGLSEKEFAALCTFNQGEDNEFMGLRYEEFVSLNTYEIQKLKSRVAELEDKLKSLE